MPAACPEMPAAHPKCPAASPKRLAAHPKGPAAHPKCLAAYPKRLAAYPKRLAASPKSPHVAGSGLFCRPPPSTKSVNSEKPEPIRGSDHALPGHGQHFAQHLLLLQQVLVAHFGEGQLVLQMLGM
ncbi:MAG: hypothetical protein JWP58_4557 [Hymenobacter sp.]|nr:hypothetical protein [Hymenobacter sp.]